MTLLEYDWTEKRTVVDPEECARSLGISPLTARILSTRDLGDLEGVRSYWSPRLDGLYEPEVFKDMDIASQRLAEAVRRGEKIVIWGDYDVDGATSVSLLLRFFRFVGASVDFHIPNRLRDGYGLNIPGLEALAADGARVVVTVDNGISALKEARAARELGLDLIITDHHEPGDTLPEATAIVDHKRPDCPYPDKSLAGIGVAFKLACAVSRRLANGRDLSEELKGFLLQSLALVAVGTVADLVPLTGENRVLVGYGLHQLDISPWPGLRALMEVSECSGRPGTSDIAFRLGPRINAAGRLNSADTGVRLMTTEDPADARRLAEELDRSNTERRQIERSHTGEILGSLDPAVVEDSRAVVVAGDGWHPGVIGIVASRLVEAFHRPAVVCALDGDTGKGSCRSVPGFHLHEVLTSCSSHLESFGGHAMAAGFSIRRDNWEAFSRDFRIAAEAALVEAPRPALAIDAWVDLAQLDSAVMGEIDHLAPFGMNNPRPLLAARGVQVSGVRRLGRDGNHLSFQSVVPGAAHKSIAYKAGELAPRLKPETAWDVAFEPKWNTWNGRRNIELNIKGLRPAVQVG